MNQIKCGVLRLRYLAKYIYSNLHGLAPTNICVYIYVLAKELHSEEQIGWWLQHWCGSLSKSILCLQVVCWCMPRTLTARPIPNGRNDSQLGVRYWTCVNLSCFFWISVCVCTCNVYDVFFSCFQSCDIVLLSLLGSCNLIHATSNCDHMQTYTQVLMCKIGTIYWVYVCFV